MTALITPDMSKVKGFDDRRFINDLHKNHMNLLINSEWDILIIDLIDERHETYFFEDSALTYTKSSKEYIDILMSNGQGQLFKPFDETMINLTKQRIHRLSEDLHAIRGDRPIIIHQAKYATHYFENNKLIPFSNEIEDYISKWNFFLEQMYAEFEKYDFFTKISLSEKFMIAGGKHKWDLIPYHYNRDYYVEFYRSMIWQHL
jgi:hypothetical protein